MLLDCPPIFCCWCFAVASLMCLDLLIDNYGVLTCLLEYLLIFFYIHWIWYFAFQVAKHKDPRDACAAIVAESYRLWLQYETRTDDITVIVVHVNGLSDVRRLEAVNLRNLLILFC